MFFGIICSELLRRFTEETFLFEIYFHFSSMKTFPFGLFLIGHISVFQLNDPKSMNFFYNFWIFRISCGLARLNLAKTYALTYFSIRWNGRTFHKTQFHYVILIHYGNRGNPFFSKYIDSINKMSVFPFPSQESTSIYFNFDYCERCFQIWTNFVIKNQ